MSKSELMFYLKNTTNVRICQEQSNIFSLLHIIHIVFHTYVGRASAFLPELPRWEKVQFCVSFFAEPLIFLPKSGIILRPDLSE
jgi:hypothetical protein